MTAYCSHCVVELLVAGLLMPFYGHGIACAVGEKAYPASDRSAARHDLSNAIGVTRVSSFEW